MPNIFEVRNTIILTILIFLFLFFNIWYWDTKKHSESFSTIYLQRTFPIYTAHEFKETWQNQLPNKGILTHTDGRTLKWTDLKWSHSENVLAKNKDFSVSFWIFDNGIEMSYWTEVFNVYCGYERFWYDRTPGIFLWPNQWSALHIRCNVDGKADDRWQNVITSNSGSDDRWSNWYKEINKNLFPKMQPTFITVSFSPNGYTFYKNGDYIFTFDGLEAPPVDVGPDAYFRSTYCYNGGFNNSFCMKDLCIYDSQLSTDDVLLIYNRNKANSDICGALRKLNIPNSACQESFTTLSNWMFSYQESFSTQIQTPIQIQLPNNKINFYSYPILKDTVVSLTGANIGTQQNIDNPMSITMSQTHDKIATLRKEMFPGAKEDKYLKYRIFDQSQKNYINIPEPLNFNKRGLSFCLWFNAKQGNTNWTRLFDFGNGPGQDNIICAFLHGCLQFYVVTDWSPNNYLNWKINHIDQNVWYHLVWTLHPKRGWNIYLNGVKIYSGIKTFPRLSKNSVGKVKIAQHYDFRGWVKEFEFEENETLIEIADVSRYTYRGETTRMDGISSIEIPKGITVTWYDQPNFQGTSLTRDGYYRNDGLNRRGEGWNDRIRSLKIYGSSASSIVRTNQYIGKSNWSWDKFYDGFIGDFRIYDKRLTNAQVIQVFTNPQSS